MNLRFRDQFPDSRIRALKFDRTSTRLGVLRTDLSSKHTRISFYGHHAQRWTKGIDIPLWEPVDSFTFGEGPASAILALGLHLVVLDTNTGQERQRRPRSGGLVVEIEWLPTGHVVLATSLEWPPVKIYSLDRDDSRTCVPAQHEVSKHLPRLAVSRSGKWIAFCHVFEYVFVFDSADCMCLLWADRQVEEDAKRHAAPRPWEWTHFARRLWFSENEEQLAVASQPRDRSEWSKMAIRVGDRQARAARSIQIGSAMGAVEISPNFDLIAASLLGRPNSIGIWETGAGTETREVLNIEAPARDVRFSPDGKHLATAAETGISLYDV